MFEAQKISDLLNSEEYKSYMNVLSAHPGGELEVHKNSFISQGQKIQMPQFKNINDMMERLKQEKLRLLKEFQIVYNKIIFANQEEQRRYKTEYESLLEKIDSIDNEMDDIIRYVHSQDRVIDLESKVRRLEKKKLSLSQKTKILRNKINHGNPNQKEEYRVQFKEVNEKYKSSSAQISILKALINRSNNTDYIAKPPVLQEFKAQTPPKKTKITRKPKSDKPPKAEEPSKKAVKKLSPKQVQSIVNNTKTIILDKFRFKTKEDCLSRKVMTKDEIVKVIDENQVVRDVMPKNYKTLSKEKICEFIFSENKKN